MSPAEITLAFLGFAIVMFFWEKIPLVTTAMICAVGLIVTGVMTHKTGFLGIVDSNVILFGAMFIVGAAFFETGMADEVGKVVAKVAKTERQVIVVVMLVVGVMSGMLSNTGTAAVLIPVVVGIASKMKFKRSRLLMPIVSAAALGGCISLVGSPPNMLAQSTLNGANLTPFGFFEYAWIGVPMLLTATAFYATIGYGFLPVNNAGEGGDAGEEGATNDFSGVPAWKRTGSLVILFGTVLGMVFEKEIGIHLSVIACIGAIALIVTGIVTEKQALKAIDLQTVFLFGGMLSVAKAMDVTGAGVMVANVALSVLGDNPSPYLLLAVILLITSGLSNFMSNTASAAILCPIALNIATSLGADPKAVLMAVVVGAALSFLTPVGSPPNTMVLTLGGYRFIDYVKAGLPVYIICLALCMVILPVVFPFYP